MKMVKMTIGDRLAIGIAGTPAEIEGEINAAYNWNYFGREKSVEMETRTFGQSALAAELREGQKDRVHSLGCDGFVYFYTTPKRLERGLKNRILNRKLNAGEGTKGKSLWPEVCAEFEQTLKTIETDYFLRDVCLEARLKYKQQQKEKE